MTYKALIAFAISASALSIGFGSPLEVNPKPHLIDAKYRIPYYMRDYYVRLTSYQRGKEDKLCGGVRLSDGWVLTAAECLDKDNYSNVRMTTIIRKANLIHLDAELNKFNFRVHPKYDPKTKENNLALFRLEFEKPRVNVSFIADLPTKKELKKSLINETFVVTGYDIRPSKPDRNQVINVPSVIFKIYPRSLCKNLFTISAKEDEQLCALPLLGRGITQDDIGAPLILLGYRKLYGIVLNVRPIAEQVQNAPILFTKIEPYVEWITSVTDIRLRE